jgi:hypothetical protein
MCICFPWHSRNRTPKEFKKLRAICSWTVTGDWDTVVSIATSSWLEDSGRIQVGDRFSVPVLTGLEGPPSSLFNGGCVSFPGGFMTRFPSPNVIMLMEFITVIDGMNKIRLFIVLHRRRMSVPKGAIK